jgi:16S rRNA processing protein RimM
MVVMGRVTAPFGVDGRIKLQTFTASPDSLLEYPDWWVGREGSWQRREVEEAAVHGGSVVAKLKECDDRDAALALKGAEVAVPREALPENEAGEYYWADLQGLRVVNLHGEELGRVSHLLATGANDVLVVQGGRERLIPFVDAYVVKVDLAQGELVVDWGADF